MRDPQEMATALNVLGSIAQAGSLEEVLRRWGDPAIAVERVRAAVGVCETTFAEATSIGGIDDPAKAQTALRELRRAVDGERLDEIMAAARGFCSALGLIRPVS
jgi:hypothetical protein